MKKKANRIFKTRLFEQSANPRTNKSCASTRLNSKGFHSDVTTFDFDFFAHEEQKPIFKMITAFSIPAGGKRSHTVRRATGRPRNVFVFKAFFLSLSAVDEYLATTHLSGLFILSISYGTVSGTITVSYRHFDVVVFNNTLHR